MRLFPAAMFMPAGSIALAASPSFDCARARAADEIAICADDQLAELDVMMSAAYSEARRTTHRDEARGIAREGLAARANCAFRNAWPAGDDFRQEQRAERPQAGIDDDGDAVIAWQAFYSGSTLGVQARLRQASGKLRPVVEFRDDALQRSSRGQGCRRQGTRDMAKERRVDRRG